MTFQPPPPPPPPPVGPPPGGQPPGAWGPPPGGAPRPAFNAATVNPLDWGILGAGLLALIFSFISYYTVDFSYAGYSTSASASAWHGFFGWFAALCALAGAIVVAIALFMPHVQMPFAARMIGLILFAVATICVILALFIFPGGDVSGPGVDEGRGFGYWVSLIVIIAGLVLSLMRFQQTGGKLPGALANMPNIGSHGPQGPAGGPGMPPPGGYAPPPAAPPAAPPPGYGPPPQP